MNWRIRIVLLSLIIAIVSHGYLSFHYYPLHIGASDGEAICSINSQFDCDTVSASKYSSFFGIPLAVWGLMTSFILFVMLLVYALRLTEAPQRFLRLTLIISGLSALASIVMASISLLYLKTYCLFCIFAYLTSFITFELLRREQTSSFFSEILEDGRSILSESRSYWLFFVSIPLGAFFMHKLFLQHYGAENIESMVQASFFSWQANSTNEFNHPPLLTKGSENSPPVMTITEFADFRCGHCRLASTPLNAFVKSKSDVKLQFYTFPLDSSCNPSVSRGDGLSCRLAKAVLCAEKQKHGWDFHHFLFSQQETLNRKQLKDELDWELKKLVEQFGLNLTDFNTCIESSESHEQIKTQAQLGSTAKVEGTPTIYVNGKKLPQGQIISILEKVYEHIKNEKKLDSPENTNKK